jgi:hypothetical protein
VRLGHVGRARFVASDDEVEALDRVVERIEQIEVTLAGDAKRPARAVRQQRLGEGARGGDRSYSAASALKTAS